MKSLLRPHPYLRQYRLQATVALVLLFCVVVADLAIPHLTRRIIDQGIMASDLQVVLTTSFMMAAAALLSAVLALINNYLSVSVSLGFGANLRTAMMHKV